MKTNAFVAVALLAFPLIILAEEPPAALGASATQKGVLDWNDRRWWETMQQTPKPPTITLGKSDFVVSGALVETFQRRPPATGDETVIEKMRRWPVVSLFVPQPMPWPTRQGKYFAWGQRDVAWSTLADRPIPGPSGSLISVGR